eukprot:9964378-Ditylum_brightwellii.AAC.1
MHPAAPCLDIWSAGVGSQGEDCLYPEVLRVIATLCPSPEVLKEGKDGGLHHTWGIYGCCCLLSCVGG